MIRIGHNPNTNMLPLFYYLPRNHPLLTWVTAEPTGHNAMLAAGRIDLAPISSFSYGEHWQDYAILSGLSVSNKGRVGSILLFSKVPLNELNGRIVALTVNSATSVNLLKILLWFYYDVTPVFRTMTGGLDQMFAEADAALLIADLAIKEAMNNPNCLIYDLGEEWVKQTGCSMTFAVWAYPRNLIDSYYDELIEVQRLLLKAKESALGNMEEIVSVCTEMLGGNRRFWYDYFERFSYGLDADLLVGLKKYYSLCYEAKLLPKPVDLNIRP